MRKLKTIEIQRLSIKDSKAADKLPLAVVLDDMHSLYNVGSVFRSCNAFRAEAVYLCGITATPPHPEIHKTTLGGEGSVDWRYFAPTTRVVEDSRERGYCVYAIEQVVSSTKLQYLFIDRSQRYVVVFGNEAKDVYQDTVDACDGCLEIPQFDTKRSFNVSVTAGIVVWEFTQKLLL